MIGTPAHDPLSLTQMIGYAGMMLGILAFLQKSDTRMKMILVVGTCFLVTHFIMLGTYMAAFAAGLAGSRAGLSIFHGVRKKAHYFTAFYIVLTIGLGCMAYERPLDFLPILAAANGTYAFFYLEGFQMRCAILVGTVLWIIHNALALSYGPLMMESFILAVNLITIARMHRAKRLGYNV